MYLSVVIPCLNEMHRLKRTLDEVVPYLESKFERYEILFVDDRSTDGTINFVDEIHKTNPNISIFVQPQWLGKGAALRQGALLASGDAILLMDADHATPIQEIENFLLEWKKNPHVVVFGARLSQDDGSYARRIVSLFCLLAAHLIVFRKAVADSQCGFKLFPKETAKKLFALSRTNGGMIDVELIHLVQRLNIPCVYVPVTFRDVPGSRISIWRCILTDPLELLKIRLRGWLGQYNRPAHAP